MALMLMTEPLAPARNGSPPIWAEKGLLFAILLVAAALRVHGIGFGLPALNDPDEPLFVMTALDMLRSHSLDPHWFGHPGTITFYCLELVILAVGTVGIASGRFADVHALVAAVYADPGILFLPARLFFAAMGVCCVWLTWRLGRRLGGPRVGLMAAAFLAVNAVHIHYSQLIRTDVQASLFMLLATLAALAIARDGRRRDYLLAGLFVGLGCATKWPAAAFLLGPVVAGLWRLGHGHREGGRIALSLLAAPVALAIASPYLILDFQTVLGNLAAEARPVHPGATGQGFLFNLGWYLRHPLRESLGIAGLVLAAAGTLRLPLRDRTVAVALLPGPLALLVLTCAQPLLWERWIVPLLPFAVLMLAYALCGIAAWLRRVLGRPLAGAEAMIALLLILPMLQAARAGAIERTHDTRQMAAAWVRSHAPPGSRILVEEAALDLVQGPWHVLFPLGPAGCVDARAALAGHIRYSDVEKRRAGSPVLDLGHVDPSRLATCRADYAIFSHYESYRENPGLFARELSRYELIARKGRIMAHFVPQTAASYGPVVYVVRLDEDNKVYSKP